MQSEIKYDDTNKVISNNNSSNLTQPPEILKIDSDDIFFHMREVVYNSIRKDFFSWITIYNHDPHILEVEYPDILQKIINTYDRNPTNAIVNEDTPKIIANNYRVIISNMYNNMHTDILKYVDFNDQQYYEFGKEFAKYAIEKELDTFTINDYFASSNFFKNTSFVRGLVETYPNLFIELIALSYNENIYNTARQAFIENKRNYKLDARLGYRRLQNRKAFQDTEIVEILFELNGKKAFEIIPIEDLIDQEDLLVRMFKQYELELKIWMPSKLRSNSKLQLISLENDFESIYCFENISDPKIIEYLIKEDLIYNEEKNIDLTCQISAKALQVPVLREYFFSEAAESNIDATLLDETIKLIFESFEKGIDADNLKKVVLDYAEHSYEKFKIKNSYILANVRQYLFTMLNSSKNKIDFLNNFVAKNYFESVFGNEFEELIEKYFEDRNNKETINKINEMCRKFGDLYKQKYIKHEYEETISNLKTKLYTIDRNSPIIRKQLVEKKQRIIFKDKFQVEDTEIRNIVNKAIQIVSQKSKTDYPLTLEEIRLITEKYVLGDEILLEPARYQELLKKVEVGKLINRLNSGNINENSQDFINNQQYIKSKIENGKKVYYTDSFTFTREELEECSKYIAYLTTIKQINGQLMPYIKKIEVELNRYDYSDLQLDFNSKNYIFKKELFDNVSFEDIGELLNYLDVFQSISPENKETLYDLFFKQDLFAMIMMGPLLQGNKGEIINNDEYEIDDEYVIKLIGKLIINIEELVPIMGRENITVDNLSKIQKYVSILQSLSKDEIQMLGTRLINMTVDNNAFNPNSIPTEVKLEKTSSLYKRMLAKNDFTVPRSIGSYNDIVFEVMNQDDPHFLTCGFETDACFRIGGHDNDFLHYCALNKNGFVIKISDSKGNFLGRASGFRNGNGLYLNQLRTIYDQSGNNTKHIPPEFKKTLIDALKACTDKIIQESSMTDQPIDFAVINHAYSLKEFDINLYGVSASTSLTSKLYTTPVSTQYQDWIEFAHEEGLESIEIDKKGNIITDNYSGTFATDYPNYGKTVLSTRDPSKKVLDVSDIKEYDPIAYYHQRTFEEKVTLTQENYEYFNNMKHTMCMVNGEDFEPINPDLIGAEIEYSNGWYVIRSEAGIIESTAMLGAIVPEDKSNTNWIL